MITAKIGHAILAVLAAGCVAFGLAGCGGGGTSTTAPPFGNTVTKSVSLNAAQENPAVTSTAMGLGTFTVNVDNGAVTGSVTTTGGLAGTVAHIHDGAVGVNGPILIPLTQGPTNTWSVPANSSLTASQVQSFLNGTLYVNVHSTANPGGETRAQIGRQVYYATLRGSQETPPVTTTTVGNGTFLYDPTSGALTGTLGTNVESVTAAHLHIGAVGVAGPIAITLVNNANSWNVPTNTILTADQAQALLSGQMYANFHTAANPNGQIRGQLYIPSRMAAMNGASETPPNTSTATGTCWYLVNPFNLGVAGRIETSLVGATMAHAHRGAPGVAGPIVINMTTPTQGIWTTFPGAAMPEDVLASYMSGDLYCNVHTIAFPSGEVRGQLQPTTP